MKRNLFFITILCVGVSFAQTAGKVGIETDSPTETLDVKGTVRVQALPNNGETVSTPNAGTDFNATKTVVVDDNGVLGVVEGLPLTKLPNVRTISYATTSTFINDDTPTSSVLELGNIKVRYNGTNPTEDYNPISFMLVNDITTVDGTPSEFDNVICNVTKTGSGGSGYGGQQTFFSAKKNNWNEVNAGNNLIPNLGNNDFAVFNIALLNTKEVYRLTVSLNSAITRGNQRENFTPSGAQVTLFLERLTNHEEKLQ